ncbi:MAG: hypothetical protein Q8O55_06615 [Dehalococcoidales bacterium]|nr:hypothetical protein [Dehalococcoidales bacterium]
MKTITGIRDLTEGEMEHLRYHVLPYGEPETLKVLKLALGEKPILCTTCQRIAQRLG